MTTTKKKPTKSFLRQLEGHATVLRDRVGLGSADRLDPLSSVDQLGGFVLWSNELTGLDQKTRQFLSKLSAKQLSGGSPSKKLPNGKLFVLLNSEQTIERARVTLMEEIAHDYYGHKPTSLNGKRKYQEKEEQEAYWTAAAALLPMKAVALSVWLGKPVDKIAAEFGVSDELVDFRVKILGLWQEHKKRLVNQVGV